MRDTSCKHPGDCFEPIPVEVSGEQTFGKTVDPTYRTVKLPTFEHADRMELDHTTKTALELFIVAFEPADEPGERQFRHGLARALVQTTPDDLELKN